MRSTAGGRTGVVTSTIPKRYMCVYVYGCEFAECRMYEVPYLGYDVCMYVCVSVCVCMRE